MLKCCSVSCARVARNNAPPGTNGHEKTAAGLRQRRLYALLPAEMSNRG